MSCSCYRREQIAIYAFLECFINNSESYRSPWRLADYPDVKIYRKSGTWRQWHADSALIEAQDHRYIIAALADDPDGGHWLSRLIQPIHQFMVSTRLATSSL